MFCCCWRLLFFINGVSINYAFHLSTKFLWNNFSERNSALCSYHIETSQLVCPANQLTELTGFYMMETLAVIGLTFTFFHLNFEFLEGSKKITLLKKVVRENQLRKPTKKCTWKNTQIEESGILYHETVKVHVYLFF